MVTREDEVRGETGDESEEGQVTAILVRARELIRSGWCQGAFARNEAGDGRSAFDPESTQFCLLGALHRATAEAGTRALRHEAALGLRVEAAADGEMSWGPWKGRSSPGGWNDAPERTQEDVLRLFDRAIGRK